MCYSYPPGLRFRGGAGSARPLSMWRTYERFDDKPSHLSILLEPRCVHRTRLGALAAACGTALAVVAGTTAAAAAGTSQPAATTMTYDHIFVIMLENHSQSSVIGDSNAPYMTSLAHGYGMADQYYGVTHPSMPNYIASIAGDNFGIQDDNDQNVVNLDRRNLVDQLEAHHVSWDAYMEDLPANKLDRFWPDTPTRCTRRSTIRSCFSTTSRTTRHAWTTSGLLAARHDLNSPTRRGSSGSPPTSATTCTAACTARSLITRDALPVRKHEGRRERRSSQGQGRQVRASGGRHDPRLTGMDADSAIVIVTDENDYTGNEETGGWESAAGCCDSPYVPAGDPRVSADWPGGTYGGGLIPAIVVTGAGPRASWTTRRTTTIRCCGRSRTTGASATSDTAVTPQGGVLPMTPLFARPPTEDRTARSLVAAVTRPRTSPSAIDPSVALGAVAVMTTSSPSSRKVRDDPSSRRTGSVPPQVSSSRQPRWPLSGPLTVPEANRSPVRRCAPFDVRCASSCAGVQYMPAKRGRLSSVPLRSTVNARSRPSDAGSARYGSGRGSCAGGGVQASRQHVQRRDPGGHRGRERLAEERAERDVLPGLDVARRPVVEQAHAEDVLGETGHRHRYARRAGRSDDEPDLGLDVQPRARPVARSLPSGRRACPTGRRIGVPDATTVPARP